ncbi:hypothetical protein FBU30_008959 [Linnemannia zychae]|nr:hypothetical protein FBU30_008959 [Linnemannia zychae]
MDNLSPIPTPPPPHSPQSASQPSHQQQLQQQQQPAITVSDVETDSGVASSTSLVEIISDWLKKNRTAERSHHTNAVNKEWIDLDEYRDSLPSWVFKDIKRRRSPTLSPVPFRSVAMAAPAAIAGANASNTSADIVGTLLPQLERMTTTDNNSTHTTPTATPVSSFAHQQLLLQQQEQEQLQLQALHGYHTTSGPSATYRRTQSKYKQPWRRTRPEIVSRRSPARRLQTLSTPAATGTSIDTYMSTSSSTGGLGSSNAITGSTGDQVVDSSRTPLFLPHDILLAIFSHLPSRANAQQYYDRTQPSDLISCSRVNMAWRIAALSTIWQTILLPDPLDRSCRRLLHLLASSHASAQITGKNYDITEIIQRVEVDLLEATEQLAEEKMEAAKASILAMGVEPIATDSNSQNTGATSSSEVSRGNNSSNSIKTTTSRDGTMAEHITTLLQFISPFRTLSIQLPQEIESGAAEVLTRSASIPALEAIRRGIQDAQIRELDMPSPMYCSVSTFPGMLDLISHMQTLRVLILGYSSRDWPLLKAITSLPLLENLCVFDSCWSNQIWIYLFSSLGAQLRGLTVLQGRRPLQGIVLRDGIAPYCRNLTTLSIPFIKLMSGPGPVLTDQDVIPVIKTCHELQVINLSGQQLLGDKVLEAMADLWGLQTLDIRECPLMTGQNIKSVRWQSIQRNAKLGMGGLGSTTSTGIGSSSSATIMRFASVLDFNADVEDPVEMGWVRQREDEPPLDLDEDHFFADCNE